MNLFSHYDFILISLSLFLYYLILVILLLYFLNFFLFLKLHLIKSLKGRLIYLPAQEERVHDGQQGAGSILALGDDGSLLLLPGDPLHQVVSRHGGSWLCGRRTCSRSRSHSSGGNNSGGNSSLCGQDEKLQLGLKHHQT